MQFANKPSHFYAVNMAKSVCHILSKKSVISIIAPKVGQICLSAIIIKYSWKLNKNTFSKLSLYWVQDEDFRYKRDTRNYEYTMNQFPHRNTFYCHFYFFFRVSKFIFIYIYRMQSIETKNFLKGLKSFLRDLKFAPFSSLLRSNGERGANIKFRKNRVLDSWKL